MRQVFLAAMAAFCLCPTGATAQLRPATEPVSLQTTEPIASAYSHSHVRTITTTADRTVHAIRAKLPATMTQEEASRMVTKPLPKGRSSMNKSHA